MAKDLYEVLGVSKNATDDEIKKAFRRRARELHPDVNKAPDAEDQFKELNEAYDQAPKAANGKVEGDPEAIAHVEEELGDVLFSLVNVARRMGVNSENALRASCRKFRTRWSAMEQSAFEQGVRLEDMTCEEQNRLWEQAKADLRK